MLKEKTVQQPILSSGKGGLGGSLSKMMDQVFSDALYNVALAGVETEFKRIFSEGENCNAIDPISGRTVLYAALKGGNQGIINSLFESGVDVNMKDKENWTAMHHLATENEEEAVVILIKHGASPLIKNLTGQIPLHLACENESIECVDVLLNLVSEDTRKQEVSETDHQGKTPLHIAVEHTSLQTVQMLLTVGADVMAYDHEGYIPLHRAVLKENLETITELMMFKWDLQVSALNAVDGSGAAHLAARTNNVDIISLLASNGADMMQRTIDGNSPLHVAVEKGALDVVNWLVMHDCDCYAINAEGETPRELASSPTLKTILEIQCDRQIQRAREETMQ
eukprot:GCRY01000382.1.p1 GENE.GCRY01000382.1~~GCRY01000382.1.p1  ORF type:complete len:339 (-),score=48.49 GCRY01000382.1:425-1441(-)